MVLRYEDSKIQHTYPLSLNSKAMNSEGMVPVMKHVSFLELKLLSPSLFLVLSPANEHKIDENFLKMRERLRVHVLAILNIEDNYTS